MVNKKLPFRVYYGGAIFLVLAGFFISIYLLQSHYRNFTDVEYRSFCAISRAINCDTVSQSPYAIFMDLPVAFWGGIGYLLLLCLIGMARDKSAPDTLWHLIFLIGIGYSVISVILALVTIFLIRAWCIMCVISYAINFGVAFLSFIMLRRFDPRGSLFGFQGDLKHLWKRRRIFLPGFTMVASIIIAAWISMPRYWELIPSENFMHLKNGETMEGYPWIGAENPEVTIVEFGDYMCFQCRKMHYFLRQIVARYPERIRLIHRHFPMDRDYNPLVSDDYHAGAGKMAIIALYAQMKNRFWEVNDLLFEIASRKRDFNTRNIAQVMDVPVGEVSAALRSRELRLRLKHDIAVGIKHGLEGTPGFIIDGEVYSGTLPEGVMQKITNLKMK